MQYIYIKVEQVDGNKDKHKQVSGINPVSV